MADGHDAVRAFQRIVGAMDYPMLVVTTAADGERSGCLVGFSTQSSIDPPRYLVGLSDKNHTYRVATRATHLAVHVLTPADRELAELFGTETGDEVDKFAQCMWREGPAGMPLLEACQAWFVGRTVDLVALGDHVGFLLDPVAAETGEWRGDQLGFQAIKDLDPGHGA